MYRVYVCEGEFKTKEEAEDFSVVYEQDGVWTIIKESDEKIL